MLPFVQTGSGTGRDFLDIWLVRADSDAGGIMIWFDLD
jgi:hypothetical protein